jgi:hypothetical protein
VNRTLPCACGGTITADPADAGPAVLRHNRSRRHAAWRELLAAQADHDAYCRAVELLRPWMEGTDRTVGEAIAQMRAAGVDPSPVTIVFGAMPGANA